MPRVNIEQRSPQWLEWRKNSITASIVPAILGVSSHTTPYQLWAEMTGRKEVKDISRNPHVRRGNEKERPVREMIERAEGTKFSPACFECDTESRFKASLDGISAEGMVLEIKCLTLNRYLAILEDRKANRSSTLINMYVAQLQFQMLCAKAHQGMVVIFTEGQPTLKFKFKVDPSYTSKMKAAAYAFLKCLDEDTPPPMIERDNCLYDLPDDVVPSSWESAVNDYIQCLSKEKELKAQLDELKKIKEDSKSKFSQVVIDAGKNVEIDGFKVTRFSSTRINYKSLAEKLAKDIGRSLDKMDLAGFETVSQGLKISPSKGMLEGKVQPDVADVSSDVKPRADVSSDVKPRADVSSDVKPRADVSEKKEVVVEAVINLDAQKRRQSVFAKKAKEKIKF